MRFIYNVGLEHTGHHAWEAIGTQLSHGLAGNGKLQQLVREIAGVIFFGEVLGGVPAAALGQAFQAAVQAFGSRRAQPVWLNSCSYPCGGAGERNNPLRHPDLRTMHRAASAAGAEMRYLVMTRHPTEVAYATSADRVQQLSRSCSYMLESLEALPPSAPMLCVPYLETAQLAPTISTFVGANITGHIRSSFRLGARRPPVKPPQEARAHQHWLKFASCSDRLDAFCSSLQARRRRISEVRW